MGGRIRTEQHRHPSPRPARAGWLCAPVFGVSDGLVSNMGLILGVGRCGPAPGVVRLAASPVWSPGPSRWRPGSTTRCPLQADGRAGVARGGARADRHPEPTTVSWPRSTRPGASTPGPGRGGRGCHMPDPEGPRGPRPRGAGHRSPGNWARPSGGGLSSFVCLRWGPCRCFRGSPAKGTRRPPGRWAWDRDGRRSWVVGGPDDRRPVPRPCCARCCSPWFPPPSPTPSAGLGVRRHSGVAERRRRRRTPGRRGGP